LEHRDKPLPPGKLPGDLLGELLGRYIVADPSVIIGPGVGRDAAAIRVGDQAIVVKTDPITFATDDAGRYLVNVNANDIACMGATPRWLLVTALYPEHTTTPALVEQAFESLSSAAGELGISLVGGHTEITIGLDRLIQVGQMIGTCAPEDLLDLSRARAGDAVILASGIAIEGTAILAREAGSRLVGRVPQATLEVAKNFLVNPGISVLPAVRALQSVNTIIRGMHDPTEGGLATALGELATASGLGIEVNGNAIHVRPETAAICDALDLDPLGLIASGALLAIVAPESADNAIEALHLANIPGARIGTMSACPTDRWMVTDAGRIPLPVFAVDEIARYFAMTGR
jgi:hydrogenase maturation factor